MLIARCLLICLLAALIQTQKLSKKRMIELFKDTHVTKADIEELVSMVNAGANVSDKQDAASLWVQNRLSNDERLEHESKLNEFIGSLVLAHDWVLYNINRVSKLVPMKEVKPLLKQFAKDEEIYGNDVWYAAMKFYIDLKYGPSKCLDEFSEQILQHVKAPYKLDVRGLDDEYHKSIFEANRVLCWKKLYNKTLTNVDYNDFTDDEGNLIHKTKGEFMEENFNAFLKEHKEALGL